VAKLYYLLILIGWQCTFCICSHAQHIDTTDTKRPLYLHQIKANEELKALAKRYEVSKEQLLKINQLKTKKLSAGKSLKVPLGIQQNINQANKAPYFFHKIRSQEQLHHLAQTYRTSIQQLKKLNSLVDNHLSKDRFLLIPNANYKQKGDWVSRFTMSGFASFGFYAGSTWDNETNVNYTLNGRLNLKHSLIKSPWRNLTSLSSVLGFRKDIGKYFFKNIDRIEFKNQLEHYLTKDVNVFLYTGFRSQYMNTNFVDFEGNKTLLATFMAPAYTHVAVGASLEGEYYSANFGFYELKNTYVLNEEVFGEKKSVFGVPKGQTKLIEHGLSLRVSVYYYKNENLRLSSNLYVFGNNQTVEFDFRNDFSYRFNKYFKVSILTELSYDKEYAETVQFKQEVLLGFSFFKR